VNYGTGDWSTYAFLAGINSKFMDYGHDFKKGKWYCIDSEPDDLEIVDKELLSNLDDYAKSLNLEVSGKSKEDKSKPKGIYYLDGRTGITYIEIPNPIKEQIKESKGWKSLEKAINEGFESIALKTGKDSYHQWEKVTFGYWFDRSSNLDKKALETNYYGESAVIEGLAEEDVALYLDMLGN
jgi:hypothetical protein